MLLRLDRSMDCNSVFATKLQKGSFDEVKADQSNRNHECKADQGPKGRDIKIRDIHDASMHKRRRLTDEEEVQKIDGV